MIIKRHPEDFFVEELLSRETASKISDEPGPCALYRLTKRSLGTDEAIERLAAKLRLSPGRIGYAGLKDKHALTVQYVSVVFPQGGRENAPAFLETPGWKLERIGWLADPISIEDIDGNKFRVTARHLTRRQCGWIEEAREFLSVPSGRSKLLLFVNYYGDQRFGSARHGRGFAAHHLVKGDFEEALRLLIATPDRKDSKKGKEAKRAIAAGWGAWKSIAKALQPCPERRVVERLAETEGDFRRGFAGVPPFIRQMTIEAYQAWLWNEIARRFVEHQCAAPFVRNSSQFGDLIFPEAASVWSAISSLVIPLLSPRTKLEEPWKAAAESVLAEEGIAMDELRVPGLRKPYFGEIPRALFAEAREFSLGPAEPDESVTDRRIFKRRLRFYLPRGSYATVLLRALEGGAPLANPRDTREPGAPRG